MKSRSFLLAVAIAAIALSGMTSCVGDHPDAAGAGGGGLDEDAGPGSVCARPEEGCPCDTGDGPIDCYPDPLEGPDGSLICQQGARYCRDNRWGACESIHTWTLDEQSTSDFRALVDGPVMCNP